MSVESYIYTVNPESDEPVMLINKHVGFDEVDGVGVIGDQFQRELLALDQMSKKRIQVWINSPGGIVADGYNIYSAIIKSKTPVDTYCDGIAASIAGVIFQAGRKRIMSDYGKLMYHNPYGGDDDDGLSAIRDSIATMVSARCGKTEDDVKSIMNKTTWIGSQEALDSGFCDLIQNSADFNRKRNITTPSEAKAFWRESNLVLNNIFQNAKEKKTDMKKVANSLKLNPEASEEAIVEQIQSLHTRIKNQEEEIKDLNSKAKNSDDDLEEKIEELKELQDKCKALEDEITDLKAKAKAKEDDEAAKAETEKEEQAKNYVNSLVSSGKLRNDAVMIEKWVNKAKVNLADVKDLFDNLPGNGKAPVIPISNSGTNPTGGSVISKVMMEKYNKLSQK